MKLSGEGKLLRIFWGEGDRYNGQQLFEAIHLARSKGLAGATVLRGVEGFGAHSRMHKSAILDLSEDLPILIEIVDTSEKVETLLPEIDAIIEKADCGVMMTMEKVDVRKYSAGK
jgi:PII-like signaling protein